jgi:hypothetical protein
MKHKAEEKRNCKPGFHSRFPFWPLGPVFEQTSGAAAGTREQPSGANDPKEDRSA